MELFYILLLALFLISFEALREGFKLRGWHVLSASIEFVYLAAVTFMCFSWLGIYTTVLFVETLIGYLFLRYAVFDLIHNIAAGQKVFFVGSTKLYDRIWLWFFKITKFPEESWLAWTKFLLGLIALSLLI